MQLYIRVSLLNQNNQGINHGLQPKRKTNWKDTEIILKKTSKIKHGQKIRPQFIT